MAKADYIIEESHYNLLKRLKDKYILYNGSLAKVSDFRVELIEEGKYMLKELSVNAYNHTERFMGTYTQTLLFTEEILKKGREKFLRFGDECESFKLSITDNSNRKSELEKLKEVFYGLEYGDPREIGLKEAIRILEDKEYKSTTTS